METTKNAVGTATILVTHQVKRALVAGRFIAFRAGTTNVDATDRIRPYVRCPAWTCGYAGTKENATLIVVQVNAKRSETLAVAFARGAKTLAKLQAANGGAC